jgi:hypothetical protein
MPDFSSVDASRGKNPPPRGPSSASASTSAMAAAKVSLSSRESRVIFFISIDNVRLSELTIVRILDKDRAPHDDVSQYQQEPLVSPANHKHAHTIQKGITSTQQLLQQTPALRVVAIISGHLTLPCTFLASAARSGSELRNCRSHTLAALARKVQGRCKVQGARKVGVIVAC